MKHAPPAPPELGILDDLAYALFLPEGEPAAAVVVLHGAGSAKESHSGGHHRSLQHDPEVQALSRRFIQNAAQSGSEKPN
jgi:hypothetical protein